MVQSLSKNQKDRIAGKNSLDSTPEVFIFIFILIETGIDIILLNINSSYQIASSLGSMTQVEVVSGYEIRTAVNIRTARMIPENLLPKSK